MYRARHVSNSRSLFKSQPRRGPAGLLLAEFSVTAIIIRMIDYATRTANKNRYADHRYPRVCVRASETDLFHIEYLHLRIFVRMLNEIVTMIRK